MSPSQQNQYEPSASQPSPSELAVAQPASPSSSLSAPSASADPLAWLDEGERYALARFHLQFKKGGSETHPLAPSVAEGMFRLYRQGSSLREVRELLPQYGFGQVVHAAAQGGWYARRGAYLGDLLQTAAGRLAQARAEGAEFLEAALGAVHRKHLAELRRYQASDGSGDLPKLPLGEYRLLVDILGKLTGTDQVRQVKGSVQHEHQHTFRQLPETPRPVGDAAATLAAWAAPTETGK